VFQQQQIGVQRPAFAEPDPRLGDVRVRIVSPANGATLVVV
jgi:hypothetical protein